jgi:hypothetical protein
MGWTPLSNAITNGSLTFTKFLLERGARVNIIYAGNEQPIEQSPSLDVNKLLIKYKLIQNFDGIYPFEGGFHPGGRLGNYWNECKTEIEEMKNFNIGKINGQSVSLYNFLRTKDDTRLVQYLINSESKGKLENLQANNYQDFPIFADLLPNAIKNRIEEGEKKRSLYDKVGEVKLPTNLPANSGPETLTPELMEHVDKSLGNGHKSRLNLLLAYCPSSHVEQPNVEPASSKNLNR